MNIKKGLKEFWEIVTEVIDRKTRFSLIVFVILIITIPNSCQDKEGTLKILEENGYEVVEVGGYAWLGCPQHSAWRTKFVVKDKNSGKHVDGCYCTGFVKRIVIEQ